MLTNSNPIPKNLSRPLVKDSPQHMRSAIPGEKFADLWSAIVRGDKILLTGTYGFAMSFYAWLKKRIASEYPVHNYKQARLYREAWYQYNQHVFIGVKNHKVELDKSVQNPWFEIFYPDKDHFLITFSDYLGLNGAWQWHVKGIQYPMLKHKIHPFYGAYFPTRHEHLSLFDQWLSEQTKPKRLLDIGTGCGVLSFIAYAQGIANVHATDINPNAIHSLHGDLNRLGEAYRQSIRAEENSFFGSFEGTSNDLVVFNPPWLPGKVEKTLDEACYFQQGFFDSFFKALDASCNKGTTIALLFSDYALASGQTSEHPISSAIETHDHMVDMLDHISRPVRQSPAKGKGWLDNIRNKENVELYVLRKK